MKFGKEKCKVLFPGRNNSVPYRLGANLLQNSFAEDLGVLVEQLN